MYNFFFQFAFAETDDEDEYLKKQRANNAAAARARRSRQKSSVSTPAPTQQVAAFPQPPKERPDAKHHLKVLHIFIFVKSNFKFHYFLY